ncbi:hypothetical protein CYLTODRAFT_488070 [Cylindrobasidium torrendii FP15055 ss-10]|uniref:Uncharacterized protein n=1 Tax=Cylindrobasidium torrendii FP15055 ss-10 TaxID=1314674 RepID=A0A0D7BLQ2_9AGAR|nr:hypothetical protein CYLTODRAFT_488070 [Cylindrobasidium torrendii FP15055 ss-10]
MYPLYRSQDVSTCPIFENPVHHQLVLPHTPITRIEYMLGLGRRELRNNLDCSENLLLVQPCMRERLECGELRFIPSASTCKKMLNVARYNVSCSPGERLLFSEIPEFLADQCHYELTFGHIRWDKKTLLYTRHPVTGHVTTHTAPYPNLPAMTASASPWMATMAAWTSLSVVGNRHETISQIGRAMISARPPDSFQVASSPTISPSSVYKSALLPSVAVCKVPRTSSVKRTRRNEPYYPFAGSDESSRSSDDEVRPSKRTRKTRAATSRTAQTAAAPRTRARCRAQAVH